jgi:cyclohexyl-isocyanide hydratase
MKSESKLRAGFLLFPRMTQLDFTGPYEVLARLPELEVYIVAERAGPVQSEFGLTIVADHDLRSTPQLDILCVPGGPGTLEAATHAPVIAFLQDQAREVKWLTSVCTGSLLLGAAGLLKGYRATTHWLSLDLLPLVGAIPVQERVGPEPDHWRRHHFGHRFRARACGGADRQGEGRGDRADDGV